MRVLETGTQGADPFSLRRMLSLGGQTALHALLLAPRLPVQTVGLLDPALASIGLMLLLLDHGRRASLSPRFLLLGLLALTFTPLPRVNISALMTSAWLFYALLLSAAVASPHWTAGVRVGLLTGATTALKSSLLCPALAVLGAFLVLSRIGAGPRSSSGGIAAVVTFGAALAPWCVSSLASNGTPFYPLLGAGWHGSAYGVYPLLEQRIGQCALWHSVRGHGELLVLAVAAVAWRRRPSGASRELLVLLRWRAGATKTDLGNASLLTGLVVGAWLLSELSPIIPTPGLVSAERIAKTFSRPEPIAGDDERASIARSQALVPPGDRILSRVSRPDQLDFRRNEIWLIDWPGGASPPPGLRVDAGALPLVAYLRSCGVRWVLYSWAAEAFFSRAEYGDRLAPDAGGWVRESARQTFRFQDTLLALAPRYGRYRDERVLLLDLARP